MAGEFTYDVFLKPNAKDKVRVRRLGSFSQLSTNNPQPTWAWFDEWVIKPGDCPSPVRRERVAEGRVRERELAIERGLEAARVQVLLSVTRGAGLGLGAAGAQHRALSRSIQHWPPVHPAPAGQRKDLAFA